MPQRFQIGEGQAQVFESPNPLSVYQRQLQLGSQNQINQQRLQLQQQKQKDAGLQKLLSEKLVDPGKLFQYKGQQITNRVNQETMKILADNPDRDISELSPALRMIRDKANDELSFLGQTATLYDNAYKQIGGQKFIDQGKFKKVVDSAIAKEDNYSMDHDLINNVGNIPEIYDKHALIADQIARFKPQTKVSDISGLQRDPRGHHWTIVDNQFTFGKKDANGNVVPGISDETKSAFLGGVDVGEDANPEQKQIGNQLNDKYRWEIAQDLISKNGGDPNDIYQVNEVFKKMQYATTFDDGKNFVDLNKEVSNRLEKDLNEYNQIQTRARIQSAGRDRQPTGSENAYSNASETRKRDIEAMITPFGQNGQYNEPTKIAKEGLGKLRGGSFMGGSVVDASYKKGGYVISPEYLTKIKEGLDSNMSAYDMAKILGDASRNKIVSKDKDNNILFTIRTGGIDGQAAIATDIPLPLSNPETRSIINAIMNQNKGERKVYYSDIYGENAGNIYDDQEEVIDFESED